MDSGTLFLFLLNVLLAKSQQSTTFQFWYMLMQRTLCQACKSPISKSWQPNVNHRNITGVRLSEGISGMSFMNVNFSDSLPNPRK